MVGMQKVILKTLEPKNGTGYTEKSSRSAFAKITNVGVTTKYAAEAVGKEISLAAYIWQCNYSGETHLVFNDVTYKIDSVGSSGNENTLKLTLIRG